MKIVFLIMTLFILTSCAYNQTTVYATKSTITLTASVEKPVSVDTLRGAADGANVSLVP